MNLEDLFMEIVNKDPKYKDKINKVIAENLISNIKNNVYSFDFDDLLDRQIDKVFKAKEKEIHAALLKVLEKEIINIDKDYINETIYENDKVHDIIGKFVSAKIQEALKI